MIQTIQRYNTPASYFALILTTTVLLVPGSVVASVVLWAYQWWPFPSSGVMSEGFLADKVIHFALFTVCGFFFLFGWDKKARNWTSLFVLLLCYGLAIELLQNFIPGRGASFGDVIADGIGAALGIRMGLSIVDKLKAQETPGS